MGTCRRTYRSAGCCADAAPPAADRRLLRHFHLLMPLIPLLHLQRCHASATAAAHYFLSCSSFSAAPPACGAASLAPGVTFPIALLFPEAPVSPFPPFAPPPDLEACQGTPLPEAEFWGCAASLEDALLPAACPDAVFVEVGCVLTRWSLWGI